VEILCFIVETDSFFSADVSFGKKVLLEILLVYSKRGEAK